jgi:hypothetical protein
MYGIALSQTVDSNCNRWRKTSAQDAPGGTYSAVTGAIRVSSEPMGRYLSLCWVGRQNTNL